MMFGVLMCYGLFPFRLDTLAHDELVRETNYRHPSNDVVGGPPRLQYVGKGAETISITGVVLPLFKGTPLSLDVLRALAEDGKAWPLVSGYGYIFGAYVITSVRETQSHFQGMGAPLRTAFSLSLTRTDESLLDSLGLVTDNTKALFGL